MRTFKRIVVGIVMVMAVIGFVLMFVGLIGSWVARARLSDVTVNVLSAGEEVAEVGREVLAGVDGRLDESHRRINDFDLEVVELGGELAETSLLGSIINELIGKDLEPYIEAINETVVFIRDNAEAIDNAIQAINSLPFLNVENVNPEPNIFARIVNGFDELEVAIEKTREDIKQDRAEDAEELVLVVTDATNEWRSFLTDIQGSLAEADAELSTTSQELAELKESLPRTFTLITIGINIVFLFTALAFASLFFHSLAYIRNSDQSLRTLLLGK